MIWGTPIFGNTHIYNIIYIFGIFYLHEWLIYCKVYYTSPMDPFSSVVGICFFSWILSFTFFGVLALGRVLWTRLVSSWAMKKIVLLVYKGWNTTQLYGDHKKPWHKDPYKPTSRMESKSVLFRGSVDLNMTDTHRCFGQMYFLQFWYLQCHAKR